MQKTVTFVIVSVLTLALIECGKEMRSGPEVRKEEPGETGQPGAADHGEDGVVESEEAADSGETLEDFIPKNEWQTLKPGQSVPAGLHIRLNMVTGEKEAKLLDEQASTDLTIIPDNSKEEEKKERHGHLTEAVEEAFKKLQSSRDSKSVESNAEMYHYVKKETRDGMDLEELRKKLAQLQYGDVDASENKYKSMDEIKEEFDQMNVDMQTDLEILRDLYRKYQEPDVSEERQLAILHDFEYYLHQIDNARDFADMGGFSLLLKELNHTNDDIRASAAFAIGSAAQSNPPVQVAILELHILQKLIHMISQERSLAVRHKALFALSALIRHFPYAQQQFLAFGGLQALQRLFSEAGAEKLQIKTVTLVTDLVKEQEHAEIQRGKDESQADKLKQYKLVPIARHLKEQGWCDVIPSLLALTEHDYREKTLKAMAALCPLCTDTDVFKNSIPALDVLETEYSSLAEQEKYDRDDDGYFQGLLHIVKRLKFELNVLEKQKTEL